MAIVSLSLF